MTAFSIKTSESDQGSDSLVILLAADHGGFSLQQRFAEWLRSEEVIVEHLGPRELNPEDDYAEFALQVARRLQERELEAGHAVGDRPASFGLLVCRTGAGMAIVANRFRGVRAVVCRDTEEARLAREHNNANLLVLEGDVVSWEEAQKIFSSFVLSNFGGERHLRRLQRFADLGE